MSPCSFLKRRLVAIVLNLVMSNDKKRYYKWVAILLCLYSFIVFLSLEGEAAIQEDKNLETIAKTDQSGIEEKWGIIILSMRLTAKGNMLDFRYKVQDAEKASPLFDRKIKPYLIDQATGVKFSVTESPKVGALRQTRPPTSGKNYFIIFNNPGKAIKAGNKVDIVIGDFKSENLTVQ